MRKIKKYKVNKDRSLMLAVSFVKNPAIESKFLALEEEKDKNKYVALKDDYRHVVYGPVLRPSLPIYRNDGNEEYYLEFDKEAIEAITEKYMSEGRTKSFTEAHQNEVDDISIVEVWLKSDMIHDKSIALGLDPTLEVGTLFFGAKVNNDDVWQKCLDGSYQGFSIEAICGVDEINLEATVEPSEPTVEPVAEEPIVEEPKPSNEKGILSKILDLINGKPQEDTKPTEEPVVEPATEPVTEEPVIEEEPQTEPEKPNPLEEVVKNLQEEIKTLKETNNGLQEKIKELNKKPSATPTNTNPKGRPVEKGVKSAAYRAWREKMKDMV